MAKTNDRVIPLDDKLLLSLVKEKADMVEKGRVISKEMAEVQMQFDRFTNSLTDLMATANNKKLDIFKRVARTGPWRPGFPVRADGRQVLREPRNRARRFEGICGRLVCSTS
jgi:hypothetical protein